MSQKIKLIEPYIGFDEVEHELKQIFESGQLTRGENVLKLVDALKSYTGARHAFLTTSATTALSMCLKTVGVGPGDRVAVSDFSFPATANVVEDLGAVPVFVDIDIHTYNLCAEDLASKLDGCKAVIFVDAFGNPSGIGEVQALCRANGIPLIEDAACAMGSSCGGVKVGAIADLTCFSFHPRKLLTTGEGGAILTNNANYADWLDLKLSHGARGIRGIGLDFIDFGFNYRMSEIQALMGWKQIGKLDAVVSERNRMAAMYTLELEPLGFGVQRIQDGCIHNVQSVVLTVPVGVERDDLVAYLAEQQIESTLGTYCLSGTSYYSRKYRDVQPRALWLEQHSITLPCHANVDVIRVVDTIRDYLQAYA